MASKQVSGRWWDGASSASRPATLTVTNDRCELRCGEEARSFARAELKIQPRLGRLDRAVDFPGGGRFETSEHADLEALLGTGRGLTFRLEASWHMAAVAAAGLVGVLLVTYFVILPLASAQLATLVPEAWLTKLSAQTSRLLEAQYLDPTQLSRGELERGHRVFARAAALHPRLKLKFEMRASGALGANAFALPDGTIYVTDELFRLARADEELLAVLLHEIAHVEERHSVSLLVENSVLALAVFTVAGPDFTSLPLLLLGNSYSRGHEEAADAYAAKHLQKLGLSPELLATMLGRMEEEWAKQPKALALLSSHPATAERIRRLSREQPKP